MVAYESEIKNCIMALEQGGTILYPTDTIWGIGCDALDSSAIDKAFQVKNRPPSKSFIVLLAEARDILQYVAAPPPDIIDIVESFDTPTTVIYDHALEFPDNAIADDGSVAIRVVRDPFCKALIKRFRKPIISTSANLSGEPSPSQFDMIDSVIKQRVDYIVQYRQGDHSAAQPSRLIRIMDDGSFQILRP
jgi:L-threonylcarbamoyladenylate synthase